MVNRRIVRINNGTGFYVAPNYVVTAKHVVGNLQENGSVTVCPPGAEPYCAALVSVHPKCDLALLRVEQESAQFYKLDAIAVADRPAVVWGHPHCGSQVGSDTLDSASVTIGRETDAGVIHLSNANAVARGYSGGPICPQGEEDVAVGVLSFFWPSDEYGREINEAYMVPAARILEAWGDLVIEKRYSVSEPALNRFVYQAMATDFIDYGNNLPKLAEFLNSTNHICWTAIVGEGGMGKSRLSYEFAASLSSHWCCRLIRREDLTTETLNRIREEAGRDLLLLVDYAYTDTGELGQWIADVFRKNSGHQVRILLLQRQGSNETAGRDSSPQERMLSEKTRPEWENSLREGYRNQVDACAREQIVLSIPDPGTIRSIMQSYAEKNYRSLNEDELNRLYETLQKLDQAFTRPLFAMFVVDAALTEGSIQNWRKEEILRYFCNRELDLLNLNGNQKNAYQLMWAFATMTGGYCFLPEEPPAGLSVLRNLPPEFFASLEERRYVKPKDDGYLVAPMKPDLLGEFFVKDYLETHRSEIYPILEAAQRENCPELQDFLTRLFTDFSADAEFSHLCCGRNNVFENDISWGLVMRPDPDLLNTVRLRFYPDSDFWLGQYARALLNSYNNLCKAVDAQQAAKSLEALEKLSKDHPHSTEVAEPFARALFNSYVNLCEAGDAQQAAKSLEALEKLSKDHPDSTEVAVRFARALFNSYNNLRKAGDAQQAAKSLKALKKLSNDHPHSTEVAVEFAWALFNSYNNLCKAGDARQAAKSLKALKKLSNDHPHSTEVAEPFARALFNSYNNLCIAGDARQAAKSLKALKKLSNNHPHSTEVAELFAEALFNSYVNLCEAGDAQQAAKSLEALKKLSNDHPHSTEVAVQFARALFNSYVDLCEAGDAQQAAKSLEALEKLSNDHPDSTEVAVQFARALFNSYLYLCEAGDAQQAAKSLEALEKFSKDHPDSTKIAELFAMARLKSSLT